MHAVKEKGDQPQQDINAQPPRRCEGLCQMQPPADDQLHHNKRQHPVFPAQKQILHDQHRAEKSVAEQDDQMAAPYIFPFVTILFHNRLTLYIAIESTPSHTTGGIRCSLPTRSNGG